MAKGYYRLKDTGTTFYDISQGAGITADRIAVLAITAKVQEAVQQGQIIKLDNAEGKILYAKQKKQFAEDAEGPQEGVPSSVPNPLANDAGATEGDPLSEKEEDEEDAEPDAPGKSQQAVARHQAASGGKPPAKK